MGKFRMDFNPRGGKGIPAAARRSLAGMRSASGRITWYIPLLGEL